MMNEQSEVQRLEKRIKELEDYILQFTDDDLLNEFAAKIRRYPNEAVFYFLDQIFGAPEYAISPQPEDID